MNSVKKFNAGVESDDLSRNGSESTQAKIEKNDQNKTPYYPRIIREFEEDAEDKEYRWC